MECGRHRAQAQSRVVGVFLTFQFDLGCHPIIFGVFFVPRSWLGSSCPYFLFWFFFITFGCLWVRPHHECFSSLLASCETQAQASFCHQAFLVFLTCLSISHCFCRFFFLDLIFLIYFVLLFLLFLLGLIFLICFLSLLLLFFLPPHFSHMLSLTVSAVFSWPHFSHMLSLTASAGFFFLSLLIFLFCFLSLYSFYLASSLFLNALSHWTINFSSFQIWPMFAMPFSKILLKFLSFPTPSRSIKIL